MKRILVLLVLCLLIVNPVASPAAAQDDQPNVLFVAIDDLNDWVGCLGGNPQTKTPNLDKFARRQAMVMSKAYCPAAVCCPSRSAILTGRMPSSTGVYGNSQNLNASSTSRSSLRSEFPSRICPGLCPRNSSTCIR